MRQGLNSIRSLQVSERRRLRRELLKKYGPFCQLCLVWGKDSEFARIDLNVQRAARSFSLDHIIPVSEGGTLDIKNLWPTHIACNEQRKDSPLTEKIEVDFNRNDDRVGPRTAARKPTVRMAYSSASSGY